MVNFTVVNHIDADCVAVVCLVEEVVVADRNLVDEGDVVVLAGLDVVGEGDSDGNRPSLKSCLSAICRKLKIIHIPCNQPDPKCTGR